MTGAGVDGMELPLLVPVCRSERTFFGTASVIWSPFLHFFELSRCSSRANLALSVIFDMRLPVRMDCMGIEFERKMDVYVVWSVFSV